MMLCRLSLADADAVTAVSDDPRASPLPVLASSTGGSGVDRSCGITGEKDLEPVVETGYAKWSLHAAPSQ